MPDGTAALTCMCCRRGGHRVLLQSGNKAKRPASEKEDFYLPIPINCACHQMPLLEISPWNTPTLNPGIHKPSLGNTILVLHPYLMLRNLLSNLQSGGKISNLSIISHSEVPCIPQHETDFVGYNVVDK